MDRKAGRPALEELASWARLTEDCPVGEMQVLIHIKQGTEASEMKGTYRWIVGQEGSRWQKEPLFLGEGQEPLFSSEVLSLEQEQLRAWLAQGILPDTGEKTDRLPYWCRFIETVTV